MFGPSNDLIRPVQTQAGPAPVVCCGKVGVVQDKATSHGREPYMLQSITRLEALCGGAGNSVTLNRSEVTCPECRARMN